MKRTADATALPDSKQPVFASDHTWLHQVYAIYGGKAHDGVWYTWIGDWLLEIRATYPADAESAVMAMLARMTGDVAATAGAHIERCAKSQVPVRDGRPVTDKTALLGDVMLFGAMLGTNSVKQVDAQGKDQGEKPMLRPAEWCAEKALKTDGVPMLLWHAVSPAGETQPFDRISVMTTDAPPVMNSEINPIGALLNRAAMNGKTEYTVSMTNGDEVFLYAVFADRPGEQPLGALLSDWFHNKAKPLAKINPKTNNVTVFVDPAQKD